MPSTITARTYDVSSVSRRMLRKRTIAKTAMSPKAVTRLFESTMSTSATITGIRIRDITNDREYETPEWVNMYTHAISWPIRKASNIARRTV
jgi:hypothetical protein